MSAGARPSPGKSGSGGDAEQGSRTSVSGSQCSGSESTNSGSAFAPGENEGRRELCVAHVVELERQFQDLREKLYQEKLYLNHVRQSQVRNETSSEYVKGLRSLEASHEERVRAAQELRRLQLKNIQNLYDGEVYAAKTDLKARKRALLEQLKEKINKDMTQLHSDMKTANMGLDFWLSEKGRGAARNRDSSLGNGGDKVKASQTGAEKRRRPTIVYGPYLVYHLRDSAINEDLQIIRKAIIESEVQNKSGSFFEGHVAVKRYEILSYLRSLMELLKGEEYWQVQPRPACCVKFRNDAGEKAFINVCTCSELPHPRYLTEEELIAVLQSNVEFRIPLSVSDVHYEFDKAGKQCMVFDVIVNDEFYRNKIKTSEVFKTYFIMVAVDAIEQKLHVKLDRNNWVLLRNPSNKYGFDAILPLKMDPERANVEFRVADELLVIVVPVARKRSDIGGD
ncbi:unnamed protein product [Soboliphyme baturini]|uniref:PIH1 domain-containing protein n=1 Tax=Soboliphyme baturini TaxID=241478 RepID=A0A183J7V9_9BILA|nr:unnamed protein product [Soboliphyme baturini]